MRKRSTWIMTVALGVLAVALLPLGWAASQELVQVVVGNFPETQEVTGAVSIKGGIPQATMIRREGETVAPVGRHETTSLVSAGTIATEGYVGAVISLQGDVRGRIVEAATVGVLLVPDEGPVMRVFREEGSILLPLEVSADLKPGDSLPFAAQQRVPIGFPRYRVYFYNTSQKSVEANLYVYLTQ